MSCDHEGPFVGICIYCADAEIAALKAELDRVRSQYTALKEGGPCCGPDYFLDGEDPRQICDGDACTLATAESEYVAGEIVDCLNAYAVLRKRVSDLQNEIKALSTSTSAVAATPCAVCVKITELPA